MSLDHEDIVALAEVFCRHADPDIPRHVRIKANLRGQLDNLAKAQEDGPKRQWPHDFPLDWNADAARFLALVKSCPMMWLKLGRAKYIELRIDTRDCGFNLYDHVHLSPDAVVEAINAANRDFGEAPEYRPPHTTKGAG